MSAKTKGVVVLMITAFAIIFIVIKIHSRPLPAAVQACVTAIEQQTATNAHLKFGDAADRAAACRSLDYFQRVRAVEYVAKHG